MGNQGVGDSRCINILQLFSMFFQLLYHIFYTIFTHDIYPHPRPLPTTLDIKLHSVTLWSFHVVQRQQQRNVHDLLAVAVVVS